jgi:hypothetical protein
MVWQSPRREEPDQSTTEHRNEGNYTDIQVRTIDHRTSHQKDQ